MDRCGECGSERIAPGVPVAGDTGAPVAGLLAHLVASVCADCGRVTLRADNAAELYRAQGGPANIQCPSCGSVLPAAAATCEVCGWKANE
jgi:DNA-directed RNA polymerase subunit RPC12/RpoP